MPYLVESLPLIVTTLIVTAVSSLLLWALSWMIVVRAVLWSAAVVLPVLLVSAFYWLPLLLNGSDAGMGIAARTVLVLGCWFSVSLLVCWLEARALVRRRWSWVNG